jgi:hypothetical protein
VARASRPCIGEDHGRDVQDATKRVPTERSGRAKDFGELSRATSASSVELFTLALWCHATIFMGMPLVIVLELVLVLDFSRAG